MQDRVKLFVSLYTPQVERSRMRPYRFLTQTPYSARPIAGRRYRHPGASQELLESSTSLCVAMRAGSMTKAVSGG
jgi:hypothetical protein